MNEQDDLRKMQMALEEERRLLFVGLTRAMKQLHLTSTVERYSYGRPMRTIRSQFETEIECEEVDHTALRQSLGRTAFGKSVPFDDEHSQETPNNDWLDFDFGAATTPSAPQQSDAFFDPVDEDDSDFPMTTAVAPKQAPDPVALKSKMMTGAALLRSQTEEEATSQSAFAVGDAVRHPRYGLGEIIEVGRLLKRQTLVVRFDQDNRTETFVAEKCPLALVGLR